MIPVLKIENKLRLEGLNYGLPMTFVVLGGDDRVDVEEILREVILKSSKRSWVCIIGEMFDPLSYGIGTLVRGLSQLQRYVEVETDGMHRDPSWAHTVDRWVVDWQPNPSHNLNSLRSTDTIRIKVESPNDLEKVKDALEESKQRVCTKYLKLQAHSAVLDSLEVTELFKLVSRYERTRIYVTGG